MNLLDLQPALGVLILLGNSTEVESLRAFAKELIERRPARIEVWSDKEVEALAGADGQGIVTASLAENPSVEIAEPSSLSTRHTGKYRRLAEWLARQRKSTVNTTFSEIEEVLALPLPPACRNHQAHWHSYQGSAVARAIIDAGWKAKNVNLTAETLTFERVSPAS